MIIRRLSGVTLGIVAAVVGAVAFAAPVTYNIDPGHTYPAFEADHWGGLSVWRGKINRSSGTVVLDREAETGTIEVTMDMASVDFGHDGMNNRATADIFHVDQFPTATFTGTLVNFQDGKPTGVEGTLTLHGVSQPVNLEISRFQCQPHFMHKREVCGADASATIDRGAFGVDYDLENGFFPQVKLLITVEAGLPAE